ncbi:hypothetical protein [Alicyclobacillus mengziensis]|uniref:YhcN/YlaJ family sporulation lipoprotein n=1 Tax=Alicyclobacillus mengziensis TaxID=2931921 RepID=A0A9X7VWW0_9BACL|nr:hypothetical protein [Alicyclobacillus mengziensis]QSO46543.1 hypothetical protein JZ786_19070 [Alicyclobacillus mengziensis]
MKSQVVAVPAQTDQHRWHQVWLRVFAVTAFIWTSGFTFVPDIDHTNHKDMPTYNNSKLNSAKVTPTDMIPRPELSSSLMKQVNTVHFAVVIQRQNRLYAGVEPQNQKLRQAALDGAKDWLVRQVPRQVHVYVSADPTLLNHFHRFAADRATHLDVGSDIILADIERVFPAANK